MPYLNTFSGNFTAKEARHLLKRTSFGVTESMVSEALNLGLTETLEKLFSSPSLTDPPLKYLTEDDLLDPDAKYGETWVNGKAIPVIEDKTLRNKVINRRGRSLYSWSYLQMQNAGMSISEKLTLFWHNHFVSVSFNPHLEYYYMNLLRTHSLGNFKELTKQITTDPNMLRYLSGSQNTDMAPNENYSRELLELFTIGKGDVVGIGDYTNYTEDDVLQMAKVLTGWRVRGLTHEEALESYFSNFKHSKDSKTLSPRFNNHVLSENGENEYKDLIDRIFQEDECSKFIVRQLYIWFINSDITAEIETNIIEPLAEITRDNNYEIVPALKKLFSSEHFFETVFCMIKSPVDLILSATKSLLLSAPVTSIKEEYDFAYIMHLACTDLGQSVFNHPDVAGWKAYYQKPLFYKTWVNNYLLPKRLDYCKILVTGGDLLIDKKKYSVPPLVPVLLLAENITNAENPIVLITSLANQLFNYEISQNQIDSLKDILIPGLPDFEWTVEYSEFIANPSDTALKNSIENKLRSLIGTMVQMSEFQIM
ncbi:MAG: DUF1800 family protein [Polaribacter sp.]|jgi:uncharacterized protein (DUF1800 family)|uniref:DUF1800 domain-containing protein n=1 Tax=Polaribacter sp. TaxID=1920175 RepID=UPI002625914F|nr:DUF1800 family protein [Polaribacter sp.]MBT3741273.1 DUF1800 domain-containing protein [Polaribacter sp.]MBT4412772.1 DUF1800 domain-containing protein [Polaribacter sp.]MBT7816236.1 DUF1800 domain-containing protein [Polaribacter sp.]MDG1195446.1 DUF1800 family protein [Polaribacter sp.]MDG1403645.1 DUF1800 family protein [Polaribacter sp.]